MIEVEPIQTTVECQQCFAKFKANKNLNRHIKSVHTDMIVKCEQCNFTSNRKDTVRTHFKREHGNTNFICNKCIFTTKHQDILTEHIKIYHNLKRYKCRFCPLTSGRKYNIKIHERRIHKDDHDQNVKKQLLLPKDISNMKDDSEETKFQHHNNEQVEHYMNLMILE